jgi:phosphatidylserine synthase
MLGFLKDKANLLTMAGLVSSVVGIYFAVQGSFAAAMIATAQVATIFTQGF